MPVEVRFALAHSAVLALGACALGSVDEDWRNENFRMRCSTLFLRLWHCLCIPRVATGVNLCIWNVVSDEAPQLSFRKVARHVEPGLDACGAELRVGS